jgi:hypothetical protein
LLRDASQAYKGGPNALKGSPGSSPGSLGFLNLRERQAGTGSIRSAPVPAAGYQGLSFSTSKPLSVRGFVCPSALGFLRLLAFFFLVGILFLLSRVSPFWAETYLYPKAKPNVYKETLRWMTFISGMKQLGRDNGVREI